MVMIRFLRDEPSSVDRSGLTGDPDIPDPPPKDRVRGIRARLKAAGPVIVGTFRGMPRMTRLVWNASRLMTAGLTGATVVSGILLFHEGRLTEQGTHAELMRLAGSYAELFTLQASAYLD
jgi:hypothetical protein